MTLRLGDTAPDFTAETTSGRIGFHSWLGDSWALLFACALARRGRRHHPAGDFG